MTHKVFVYLPPVTYSAGMDALSNAETVVDSGLGFLPIAFPKVTSMSRKGKSVEYVHDDTGRKKWFLLMAGHSREDKAADVLIAMNIYAYVPRRRIVREVNGRPKGDFVNLLPNFVFAYLTREEADFFVKGPYKDEDSYSRFKLLPDELRKDILELSTFLTYYYDHFRWEDGRNPPIEIPQHDMRNLIFSTRTNNENVMLLHRGDEYKFKSDEEVLVVDGEFKGVTGKVIRVARQQRVLIEIAGQFMLATAYVPTAFLRKVDSCQS